MAAPTANVSMNSKKLTGLAAPSDDNDAARKKYVDDLVNGLAYEEPADFVWESGDDVVGHLDGRTVLIASDTAMTEGGLTQVVIESDGSSWSSRGDVVEKGSALMVKSLGVIYVRNSTDKWVQVSLPTDYAFGDGLANDGSGVVGINLATDSGLEIASDELKIASGSVTESMLDGFAKKGSIYYGNANNSIDALEPASDNGDAHKVLALGDADDLAYVMIADDNISTSADIAITKLAEHTISSKALGTNLDTLSPQANGGLQMSANYNGSANASISLDFKMVSAYIPGEGDDELGDASGAFIREGVLQDQGADLDADLLDSDHIFAGEPITLLRNGVGHMGAYYGSRLSTIYAGEGAVARAGDWHVFQDGDQIKFEIFEGDPSYSGDAYDPADYDGDEWGFKMFVDRS